jgi:hypothetical protein
VYPTVISVRLAPHSEQTKADRGCGFEQLGQVTKLWGILLPVTTLVAACLHRIIGAKGRTLEIARWRSPERAEAGTLNYQPRGGLDFAISAENPDLTAELDDEMTRRLKLSENASPSALGQLSRLTPS